MLLRKTGRSPRWRCFSLTQVNAAASGRPEGWTLWGAEAGEEAPGREAFRAALAARRQGRFEALFEPLLAARHEQKLDIEDAALVRGLAADAGLDMERYDADLADPELLDELRRDHQEAVERHGVFGTPTFVGPAGEAAYVRLAEVPDGAEADRAIELIEEMITGRDYLLELKRPARRRTA